jgi:hypothetical protein
MTISFWDKGGEEAAIPLPPHKLNCHSERIRLKKISLNMKKPLKAEK